MTSQLNDEKIQKYVDLSRKVINKIVSGNADSLTIFDITTIAMGVVEEIKDEDQLTGQQKKALCLQILTIVIDTLVTLKKINNEKGEEFKKAINDNYDLIMQFIDIAAFLTKNPQIINAGKFIVEGTKNICSRCFRCCQIM